MRNELNLEVAAEQVGMLYHLREQLKQSVGMGSDIFQQAMFYMHEIEVAFWYMSKGE